MLICKLSVLICSRISLVRGIVAKLIGAVKHGHCHVFQLHELRLGVLVLGLCLLQTNLGTLLGCAGVEDFVDFLRESEVVVGHWLGR